MQELSFEWRHLHSENREAISKKFSRKSEAEWQQQASLTLSSTHIHFSLSLRLLAVLMG
jgi:hypothetical protein